MKVEQTEEEQKWIIETSKLINLPPVLLHVVLKNLHVYDRVAMFQSGEKESARMRKTPNWGYLEYHLHQGVPSQWVLQRHTPTRISKLRTEGYVIWGIESGDVNHVMFILTQIAAIHPEWLRWNKMMRAASAISCRLNRTKYMNSYGRKRKKLVKHRLV